MSTSYLHGLDTAKAIYSSGKSRESGFGHSGRARSAILNGRIMPVKLSVHHGPSDIRASVRVAGRDGDYVVSHGYIVAESAPRSEGLNQAKGAAENNSLPLTNNGGENILADRRTNSPCLARVA
jgi:hypothetical protein